MSSKVWAMALVVLATSALSLTVVVRGLLEVPLDGSLTMFFAGATLHLFATTCLGILLGLSPGQCPSSGCCCS